MPVNVTPLGSFASGWGDSVVWDDAAQTLHWLDDDGDLDGRLLCIDGIGRVGRPEPRFSLTG
jgi:hypothetical protein